MGYSSFRTASTGRNLQLEARMRSLGHARRTVARSARAHRSPSTGHSPRPSDGTPFSSPEAHPDGRKSLGRSGTLPRWAESRRGSMPLRRRARRRRGRSIRRGRWDALIALATFRREEEKEDQEEDDDDDGSEHAPLPT